MLTQRNGKIRDGRCSFSAFNTSKDSLFQVDQLVGFVQDLLCFSTESPTPRQIRTVKSPDCDTPPPTSPHPTVQAAEPGRPLGALWCAGAAGGVACWSRTMPLLPPSRQAPRGACVLSDLSESSAVSSG